MALNFPNAPVNGELWTDTSNGAEYIYVAVSNHWRINGDLGGGSSVSVGITPPLNPSEGDLWFNSVNGILYTWYVDPDQLPPAGQWVDVRPAVPGGGVSGVTSIDVVGSEGIVTAGGPITTAGTITAEIDIDSLTQLP